MPTYTFKNTDTGETFDATMKMAEYDDYVAANPNFIRVYERAAAVGDPILLGLHKPSDAFRDILKNVQKQHKNLLSGGTNINTW